MAPEFSKLKLNTNFLGSGNGGTFGTIISNNPVEGVLGQGGSTFINSIMNGQGFEAAMGNAAQGVGQAAKQFATSIFSDMFNSALKIGTERAKSALSESKINKANKEAEAAAENGTAELNAIIAEASNKAGVYNADLAMQLQLLNENQTIIEGKKEELANHVKLIRQQIENYNNKKAERDKVQAEYDNADESKKEDLKKKLDGLNAELGGLAPTISSLQAQITESQLAINKAIADATTVQKWAVQAQEELVAINANTQTELNTSIENTENIVMTNTTIGAKETAKYYSNSEGYIQYAQNLKTSGILSSFIPVIGAASGAMKAGVAGMFITLGNDGKAFSNGAIGIIQGIGNEFFNKLIASNGALEVVNTSFNEIGNEVVTIPTVAQTQIDEANTALEENKIEEFTA